MYHINYVEGWDEILGEFVGAARCCAEVEKLAQVPREVTRAWADSVRLGWGPGMVVVTDDAGNRIDRKLTVAG